MTRSSYFYFILPPDAATLAAIRPRGEAAMGTDRQTSMMDTRLYHLDLIRLAAFILLICCHTCDPFNAAATYGAGIATYEYTLWGSIYGALVRPCVPLFVMLTGALLLKQKGVSSAAPSIDMKAFYRKRIPRVLLPFVIWSAVYYVWLWPGSLCWRRAGRRSTG